MVNRDAADDDRRAPRSLTRKQTTPGNAVPIATRTVETRAKRPTVAGLVARLGDTHRRRTACLLAVVARRKKRDGDAAQKAVRRKAKGC
jgi:hypothetical protein